MAADLLTTIRSELDARLSELRPLLAEYERLLAAVDALGLAKAGGEPANVVEAPVVPTSEEPASPVPAPRRRGRPRGSAAGAIKAAASRPPAEGEAEGGAAPSAEASARQAPVAKDKPARAPRGAARQAILAALEHGSHTVGELAIVTAMSGPNITVNLRRLLQEKTIIKTSREGKTAYALTSAVAEVAGA
jgi:hypothetical protein